MDGRPNEDLVNDVRLRIIGWLDHPSHEALSLSSTTINKIIGAYLDEAYWCVVWSQHWVVTGRPVDSDNEYVRAHNQRVRRRVEESKEDD